MPTLRVVTPDGQLVETKVPEGADLSPEDVGNLVKEAGIKTVNPTRQKPLEGGAQRPGEPHDRSASPGAALAKSATSILRAVKDRTTEPLSTLFTLSPKVGTWDRLMAGAEIVGTVAAPAAVAAGAGVQSAYEAATDDPEGARAAGSAAEIGAGIMDMANATRNAVKGARGLIGLAKGVIAGRGMTRAEQVGKNIQRGLRTTLSDLGKQYGRDFDTIETAITKATPEILPGTTAHTEAQAILSYIDDAQVGAGPRADALIKQVRTALDPKDPKPISMRSLINLRKILQERAGVSAALDPDASVVGKKAGELRDIVLDVIRAGAPDTEAARLDELRHAYRTNLIEPERFLKAVTKESTTPLAAFKAVFMTDDPHKLRTVAQVLQSKPNVAHKLKLGFAESLQDVLTDPSKSKAALRRLDAFAPLLQSTGMFTANEMSDLRFLLEKNLVPSIISELTSNARASQVLLRGALGAQMATHMASHPVALAVSAIAFGGLPQLRRAAMLPAGSEAQRRMLAIVLRNSAAGIRALTSDQRE